MARKKGERTLKFKGVGGEERRLKLRWVCEKKRTRLLVRKKNGALKNERERTKKGERGFGKQEVSALTVTKK